MRRAGRGALCALLPGRGALAETAVSVGRGMVAGCCLVLQLRMAGRVCSGRICSECVLRCRVGDVAAVGIALFTSCCSCARRPARAVATGCWSLNNMWCCRVADFFLMLQLRMEALHVICQKAEPSHIALLQDTKDALNLDALAVCVKQLALRQREELSLFQRPR